MHHPIKESLRLLLADAFRSLKQEGVIAEARQADINLSLTRLSHRGEFTSTLALQLASELSVDAVDLATRIVEAISATPLVAAIEVAEQGFINFRLNSQALGSVVSEVVSTGDAYGVTHAKVAEPVRVIQGIGIDNSPLPLKSVPVLSTAASLASLLESAGSAVITEHYIDTAVSNSDMLDLTEKDMDDFGVKIDTYVRGADWSVASAYLSDLLNNSSDYLLCVIPADQPRETAALKQVATDGSGRLEIVQVPTARWVSTVVPCQSSQELRQVVGRDVMRFFSHARPEQPVIDLDLTLADFRHRDNPLYVVQYAHAQMCSVLRQVRDKGIAYNSRDALSRPGLLYEPTEVRLMTLIALFPEIVADAGAARDPHQVISYLQELANSLNKYYGAQKWLTENHSLRNARLNLAQAVRQVLANGLRLIGVAAPEVL